MWSARGRPQAGRGRGGPPQPPDDSLNFEEPACKNPLASPVVLSDHSFPGDSLAERDPFVLGLLFLLSEAVPGRG